MLQHCLVQYNHDVLDPFIFNVCYVGESNLVEVLDNRLAEDCDAELHVLEDLLTDVLVVEVLVQELHQRDKHH